MKETQFHNRCLFFARWIEMRSRCVKGTSGRILDLHTRTNRFRETTQNHMKPGRNATPRAQVSDRSQTSFLARKKFFKLATCHVAITTRMPAWTEPQTHTLRNVLSEVRWNGICAGMQGKTRKCNPRNQYRLEQRSVNPETNCCFFSMLILREICRTIVHRRHANLLLKILSVYDVLKWFTAQIKQKNDESPKQRVLNKCLYGFRSAISRCKVTHTCRLITYCISSRTSWFWPLRSCSACSTLLRSSLVWSCTAHTNPISAVRVSIILMHLARSAVPVLMGVNSPNWCKMWTFIMSLRGAAFLSRSSNSNVRSILVKSDKSCQWWH